jgi:hypothetical protein
LNDDLDPKVMEQVSNLPENSKRQEILPPEKFKSRSAGDEGIEPPTCGFGDRCSTN